MWKEVVVRPVEILLDPTVPEIRVEKVSSMVFSPGLAALLLIPGHHPARLGLQDHLCPEVRARFEGSIAHLDKLGHVPDQVVVDPLVVQHDDGVHLEGLVVEGMKVKSKVRGHLGDVLDLVVALAPDPATSVDDNARHLEQ